MLGKSGFANAKNSLARLLSDAPLDDFEHHQIDRVYQVLVAPYQGMLFIVGCSVLWDYVPNWWLIGFLLLFATEVIVKIVYTNRYNNQSIEDQKSGYWRRVMWIGMAYSGVVYGLAGLVMIHPMPIESLVVVIGVFASSVCLTTIFGRSYLPICFTTIIPMFVPILFALFASGNWKFQLLAFMLSGLCVLLVHLFRITSTFSSNLINARAENQRLLDRVTREKQQAEEQRTIAEQAVVEKNLFIAAASHDLRQPLHAFGLFLSNIKDEDQSDRSTRLIENMEKSTNALNHLFDNLLDLSRLDAGVVVVDQTHQLLGDVLSIIRNEFGEIASAKNIGLVVSGDELCVRTDKVLLERILRNLAANAIEYTDTGTVTISARTENSDCINIEVCDTGCGIPEVEVKHIFSEYHQIKDSSTTGKGVGLGLAIVDKICRLLEYTLTLSTTENVGTTFNLLVPIGNSRLCTPEKQKPDSESLKGRKILVVDDNEDILLGMELLFSSWGCTPLIANNAGDAIDLVRNETPDPEFLVCDLQLAGHRSGLDVIKEINSQRDIPIPASIVTGDTTQARLKEIKAEGITVLHKPVVAETLKETICTSLRAFEKES